MRLPPPTPAALYCAAVWTIAGLAIGIGCVMVYTAIQLSTTEVDP